MKTFLYFPTHYVVNPFFLPLFSAVPSAPADIKAVTSGDSSVLVSWRPPSSPNGRIRRYTVYRREVVNGEEVRQVGPYGHTHLKKLFLNI